MITPSFSVVSMNCNCHNCNKFSRESGMLRGEAEGKTGPGFAVSAEGWHDALKKNKKKLGVAISHFRKKQYFCTERF